MRQALIASLEFITGEAVTLLQERLRRGGPWPFWPDSGYCGRRHAYILPPWPLNTRRMRRDWTSFLLALVRISGHATPVRSNLFRAALLTALVVAATATQSHGELAARPLSPAIHKLQDIVIYKDDKFYSAFPSIVRRPGGELLVAFRRAPDRRRFGEHAYTHTDPNSYLMLVRSRDGGKTWSQTPELI